MRFLRVLRTLPRRARMAAGGVHVGEAELLRDGRDPVGERRAERRARALLRSCVGDEEWAMYAALGLIRVWGSGDARCHDADGDADMPYAFLIYPHEPVVCHVPQTHRLLGEYHVTFPDARLSASDDVLAKWMALTGDEGRLIDEAEMHPPGRTMDPERLRYDLWRLGRWERAREAGARRAGSLPAL